MLFDLYELLKKYNITPRGVIQIGAHYGEENSVYEKLNIPNRVFFEPIKSNFNILKRNIGDKHLLYNFALGNTNTNLEMYVETYNNGQSCSILKPEKHLIQHPKIEFNLKELVEVKRLDDVGLILDNYNMIIIDVQGYELEVFKGATNTLNRIDFIISEINRDNVYENCAQIDDLINFLSPFGFELVESHWKGVTYGDGLFIKKTK
jgi:FkbM family methyltransferase